MPTAALHLKVVKYGINHYDDEELCPNTTGHFAIVAINSSSLVPHIYDGELGQHWFGVKSEPVLTNCQLDIGNKQRTNNAKTDSMCRSYHVIGNNTVTLCRHRRWYIADHVVQLDGTSGRCSLPIFPWRYELCSSRHHLIKRLYNSDITWPSYRLKSPATRLFVEHLLRPTSERNLQLQRLVTQTIIIYHGVII